MSTESHGFSANKVFGGLFALTTLEVLWGYAGGVWWDWGKLALWGGLLFFAFWKGWLIAVYFMHLKFEGWVVKSLLLPTPLLILVIYGFISPDISRNEQLDHPIGSMYDDATGRVIEVIGASDAGHGEHGGEGTASASAHGPGAGARQP